MKALVDTADFASLARFRWHVDRRSNGFVYAVRKLPRRGGTSRKVYLHREIAQATAGVEVDHLNGNTLDNRRENLRLCSHRENIQNAKLRSDNTSGARGVRFHKEKRKWQAYIRTGRWTHLGYFATREEAVTARRNAEVAGGWVTRQ